jgi:hypothetical protein
MNVNMITGTMPLSITSLESLQELALGSNFLSGSVDDSVGQMAGKANILIAHTFWH